MQQGGIRGKADSHTTAKRKMPRAKQVLRKCLSNRPQSEEKNVDLAIYFRSIFSLITASMRKYAGKLNHLKTSDNLDIGTKKNVVSDFIGRDINRIDEHQKLWVQVGRGVTAKKRKPENVRLSRTGIMTHNTSYNDDWELANWKGFQKVLFRLQKRIFKAVRERDRANARKL